MRVRVCSKGCLTRIDKDTNIDKRRFLWVYLNKKLYNRTKTIDESQNLLLTERSEIFVDL